MIIIFQLTHLVVAPLRWSDASSTSWQRHMSRSCFPGAAPCVCLSNQKRARSRARPVCAWRWSERTARRGSWTSARHSAPNTDGGRGVASSSSSPPGLMVVNKSSLEQQHVTLSLPQLRNTFTASFTSLLQQEALISLCRWCENIVCQCVLSHKLRHQK